MRETGYYWCRQSDGWAIFEYRNDGYNSAWYYFGIESTFQDSDFSEINETRILNPDEA